MIAPLTEEELAAIEARVSAGEIRIRGCLCSDCVDNLPTLFTEANEDSARLLSDLRAARKRIADLEAQICQAVEDGEMSLNSERRGMLNKRSVEAGESCGLCGFLLAYSGPKPVHRIASIPETTHAFRADGSELHVGDVVACGERYREESIGFVHHGIVIETRST